MNDRIESSEALHEPGIALDTYIDKLINVTDPIVEEAIRPLIAETEETLISPNESRDSGEEPPADQSPYQVESHTLESTAEEGENNTKNQEIQKNVSGSDVDRHQLSVEVIEYHDRKPSAAQAGINQQDLISQPTAGTELVSYLKFQVAGLNFAIAQNQVRWVYPWPTKTPQVRWVYPWPTKAPIETGESEWFLGETDLGEHKIKIVDIAMLVIPKSRQAILLSAFRPRLNHLLTVGTSDWGLACETVVGKVELASIDIQWRSDEGQRPWLAGTIASHKCALLDVGAIMHFLEHGCWGD